MVKRYSFEQLENFVKAFNLTGNDFGGLGNFKQAIINAMCEVHTLATRYRVCGEKCIYSQNFNSHYHQTNPKKHSWIMFDVDTEELVYNTGARDEEWSNELLDNLFLDYDLDKINAFNEQKQSTEFKKLYELIQGYYSSQGYFTNILSKNIDSLTPSDWIRLTDNKYAQKVIACYESEPLYDVGELVSLRANRECTNTEYINSFSARAVDIRVEKVLVLSNTEPIINARKGAKRYKVAPIGGKNPQPFWIEEAFLKPFKKKK